MLAVLICSLFNAVLLVAFAAGIVIGMVRSRQAIADALAFAPPVEWRPSGATFRRVSA